MGVKMKLGVVHQETGAELPPIDAEPVPGYRLIARIAEGEGGEVWRAEGPGGFPAALKFVSLAGRPSDAHLNTLEIVRVIRHPNLLAGFGAWADDDGMVVAMELADGSLWDRFIESRELGLPGIPRDELVEALSEAAKGVDYLNEPRHDRHDRTGLGIQHRDLKPRNIMLVGGGVKVADFGSACWMDATVTTHGNQGGTPAYAPPEFFLGATTRHSDQYSLAITYCHLRGGRLPFTGDPTALMTGHLMHEPDLSMLDAPERPAVSRALAKRPEDRWPTCRGFLDALRAGIVSGGETMPTPPPNEVSEFESPVADWYEPERRRSLKRPALVILAVLIVVGAFSLRQTAQGRPRSVSPLLMTRRPDPPADSIVRHVVNKPTGEDSEPSPVGRPEPSTVDYPHPSPVGRPEPPTSLRIGRFEPASRVELFAIVPLPLITSDSVLAAISRIREREADRARSLYRAEIRAAAIKAVDKARSVIRVALRTTPARLQKGLGDSYRERGDGARAIDAYSEAIRLDPTELDARIARARAYLEGGKAAAAIAEANEVIRVRPDSTTARLILARGYASAGDHARAIADFDAAIRLRPDDPDALRDRGTVHQARRDDARALKDFDESLRLDPDDPTTLNNRGLARLALGDTAGALADLNDAIVRRPKSAVFRSNLGRIYVRLGDLDKAIASFDTSLRLDPRLAHAYRDRGDAHLAKGDRAKALADFDLALRLHPDDPYTLNDRGLALLGQGEPYKAVASFDEAIRLNPRSATLHFNRGWVYEQIGDTVEALAEYDAALRLDPKLESALKARDALALRSVKPPASPPPASPPPATNLPKKPRTARR